MFFLLIIIMLCLVLVAYIVFGKDIMNPAVLLTSFFLIASISALYLYDYWRLSDFGGETVELLTFGVGAFVVGCLVAKAKKHRRTSTLEGRGNADKVVVPNEIAINKLILYISILISIVTLIWLILFVRRNGGSGSLAIMIANYKSFKNTNEANMPLILQALIKLVLGLAFCSVLTCINNMIVGGKQKHIQVALLIIPVCYLLIGFFSANRGNMFQLIFGCFVGWYIIYNKTTGLDRVSSRLAFRKGIKYAILVITGFWLLTFVTRTTEQLRFYTNAATYITSYLSGSLPSFDLYLKQGGIPCEWLGQETFVALNNNLASIGVGNHSTRFLEFRSGFGYSVVNVYTSFRRMYHDFGFIGIILLSSFQGYITERVYYAVRESHMGTLGFRLILLAYYYYTIPYVLFDDLFWSSAVSLSGLLNVFVLFIAYSFFYIGATKKQ